MPNDQLIMENPYNLHQGRKVIINMELFRLYGFYQLLNPRTKRVFGFKIYLLAHMTFIILNAIIVLYSLTGIIYAVFYGKLITYDQLFELLFYYCNYPFCLYKLYTLINNSNFIWKFYDIACVNFLPNSYVQRAKKIMNNYIGLSKTFTWLCLVFFILIICVWSIFPLVFGRNLNESSILNLMYPVSSKTFEKYFYIFYLLEFSLLTFIMYAILMFDIFIASFCFAITAQYETIMKSVKKLGTTYDLTSANKEDSQIKYCEDLKNIIINYQKVNTKLMDFFGVIRRVILIQIADFSIGLVSLAYLLVLRLSNNNTKIVDLKLVISFIAIAIEFFMECYLLELVTEKKEEFNLNLFKCNWTNMNLNFKKWMLLTQKQNNANQINLKLSPKKIISVQLFLSVINTSYTVVSVILNTISSPDKK
ncbi:uncharacterized protein LOC126897369 [Daktulosphaira vitifoliae]|uniref:uncharacterized protein LOC126897369 n=1 Tax=Daktulosphaira vitifoliae TaxID=58002 RepID=UPI0021AA64EB|nr:uncharacterized protein LOC126897369 [Daktulosphaira vitifoliae]